MRRDKFLILIVLVSMMMTVACACGNTEEGIAMITEEKENSEERTEEQTEAKEKFLHVFVCGKVKNPGVYRLKNGARIVDAIEAAGGLTKDAAETSVNQAQKIEDGQQITIPSKHEQQESLKEEPSSEESNRISINQATKEELMSLPGIGESKADSIIAYREEHGGFQSTEDLMKISGIKEGVYNKIKDKITL